MADPDVSPDHFDWIVKGRSDNQRSTLRLYRLLYEEQIKLNGNPQCYLAATELAAVAFSLWRAVFLSDTSGEFKDTAAALNKFLASLISDNTVVYSTDKNARNWSFRYYANNARFQVEKLDEDLQLVDKVELDQPFGSDKDEWLQLQAMLTKAIDKLTSILAAAET